MFGQWVANNRQKQLSALEAPNLRKDIETFFGPRAEIYLKVFDRTLENLRNGKNGSGFGFSLPAFVGGFVWFFYRRMYLYGAFALLAPIIAGLLIGGSGGTSMAAVLGLMAKPIYMQWAIARVKKADALGLVGAEREDYLRRAGGVSIVAGVLAGILFLALFAIFVLTTFYPEHFK
jgi:hypothetical protein